MTASDARLHIVFISTSLVKESHVGNVVVPDDLIIRCLDFKELNPMMCRKIVLFPQILEITTLGTTSSSLS